MKKNITGMKETKNTANLPIIMKQMGELVVPEVTNFGKKNVKELKEGYKRVKSFLKINEKVVQCPLLKYYMTSITKDIRLMMKTGVLPNTLQQILPERNNPLDSPHLLRVIGKGEQHPDTMSSRQKDTTAMIIGKMKNR